MVLCALFTQLAQRKNTLRRGKSRVRVPRSGTSITGKGAMRFAWLSARRGGWRSMVVPGVALVLSAFLGFLMATAQGWDQQRATLYENTTITGQFTSVNGRQYTGLMLEDPWQLWDSGLLSSMQVYDSTRYWMPDEMPDFPNTTFGNKLWGEWVAKAGGIDLPQRFGGISQVCLRSGAHHHLAGGLGRELLGRSQLLQHPPEHPASLYCQPNLDGGAGNQLRG